MIDLYKDAREIAKYKIGFAVSLGRDSACMLDIMSKITDFRKCYFFYWSFYDVPLPYQQRYIFYLEKKYKIKINIFPIPKKQKDFTEKIREEQNLDYICFGYRMDESLQRRGQLKNLVNAIDLKTNWAFPLRNFTSKTIRGYVKTNNILLQPEYNVKGIKHNFEEHRGGAAYFLRHFISEEDFLAAVKQDKNIEADYLRHLFTTFKDVEYFGDDQNEKEQR